MCGINGFSFADHALIERMNGTIAHRGPDDHGVFVTDGVSLGHQRLSIIDLSPAGHQPMQSPDGLITLVFNGEIYNYQEIRGLLQKEGYQFRSQSDTEVIIQAYRAYGIDCVKHFNGIFAFALWDQRERKLFLSRDRLGVKPLYYYRTTTVDGTEQIIFSSEIKAILEHPIGRKLNVQALNVYLRMLYVPAPDTLFLGIKKLLPGHSLVFQAGKSTLSRYWLPHRVPQVTHTDAVAQIQTLLDDAVRLQLISDRPVGIFLSGGIDSTIITGLAKKHVGGQINTFSVRYDVASDKFNADASLAQQTSAYFGTSHHELLVTGEDCAKYIRDVVYHMDEPVANATQVATYLLSRFTKPHATVVLGGDGGDELFGGYERYRLSRYITLFQRLPHMVQDVVAVAAPVLSRMGADMQKFFLAPGIERYLGFMAQREQAVARVLQPAVNVTDALRSAYTSYVSSRQADDPEADMMWTDLQTWLPDESLLRSDKMSMAFGIEQRVPFLDHRLVELSLRIPTSQKIRGHNKKAILKEAMGTYLPDIVLRQPKRGWFSPTSEWMRGPLVPLMKEVLSPSFNPDLIDILDFPALERMYVRHVHREEYQMNLLWAVVTFQLWYHRFFTTARR